MNGVQDFEEFDDKDESKSDLVENNQNKDGSETQYGPWH